MDKRKLIFKQFLYNKQLKFSEIEKQTGIRSNELAYFLQKLINENILTKADNTYQLTEEAETNIPFFADDNVKSPLPVVLVACIKDKKVLLIHRQKRPYEGHWSLPGGRIRLTETIEQSAIRNIKEKTFLDVKFISTNSVVHEMYNDKEATKNAFILFFVLAEPTSDIKEKDDIRWVSLAELDQLKMIPSDRWLLQNKLDSKTDVITETITGREDLDMDIE